MALTLKKSGNTTSITADGSTAIDLASILETSSPILIQSIFYYPATGGNAVTVRDGGAADGAVMWKSKSSGIATDKLGDNIPFPGGKRCKPYIVGNEIGNNDIITFHLL